MADTKTSKLIDTEALIKAPWQRALFKLVRPALEGLFGVDVLNKHYKEVAGITDPAAFAEASYRQLGVEFSVNEEDIARLKKVDGPLILVANQPYGGFEALMLIILMGRIRSDFKLMANELLAGIPELKSTFILVDPGHEDGRSEAESEEARQKNFNALRTTLDHLQEGGLLGVFPSGRIARFNPKSFRVDEAPWSTQVARLAQRTGASVVPVYFHGQNSILFQTGAMLNPSLRNSLLIRELAATDDKRMAYQIGHVITPHKINEYTDPAELTAYLRGKTFLLAERFGESKVRFEQIKPERQRNPSHQPIIDAVDPSVLEAELHALPPTNLLYNYTEKDVQVYTFNADQGPGLLRELGRLREITFRGVGEGTGMSMDVDRFDDWYDHIILWNSTDRAIAGAYRVAQCDTILQTRGQEGLYINTLFNIQPSLYEQINPCLELGRSFVQKPYQRAFWPLMLLWTGIGQYIVQRPHYTGLIGPVSITGEFHTTSKDLLVKFLTENKLNTLVRNLVKPKNPYPEAKAKNVELFNSFSIKDLNDVQDLIYAIETSDLKVPILLKHYLKMAGSILAFNVDHDFSDVLDALMYIDMRQTKTQMLRKYMTDEGYQIFAAKHNLQEIS